MAAYYVVYGEEHRPPEREVILGFPTYKRLFAAARASRCELLIRCGDFHGMDEFSLSEFDALRREIASIRRTTPADDVVTFLDGLSDLIDYAAPRGKHVIADAD